MKRLATVFLSLLLLTLLAGCSGGTTPAATAPPAAEVTPQALEGETFTAEKFTVTVPTGWEAMAVDGGVQLYKMSGEIIEVHYRGSGQSEDHAKQQAESNASTYSGTDARGGDAAWQNFLGHHVHRVRRGADQLPAHGRRRFTEHQVR